MYLKTNLNGLQQSFLSLIAELPEAVDKADLQGLRVGGLDDEVAIRAAQEGLGNWW